MELNEFIWKRAEQSFVNAYDLGESVLRENVFLSTADKERLHQILKLWIEALERMSELASDVEMARDYQTYWQGLKEILLNFEKKFC